MSQTTLQKYISRLMALLLCLMLLLTCVPVAQAAGGSCGSSLTWDFDGSTLTISGSGAMDHYSESSPAPWSAYRDAILSLSLPEGLTVIGSYAFAECTSLYAVSIPALVESIGDMAFLNCKSLAMVNFNEGLQTIGVCAFERCRALADIRLPETLLAIENHAFYMCDSLTYVTIPGSVRTIGSGVFAYCSNLIRADIHAAVTMPSWSFYGCNKLQVVTVRGASVAPESLMVTTDPLPISSMDSSYKPTATEPAATQTPEVPPADGYASSENVSADDTGTVVVDKTTVFKDNDATITVTTQTPVEGSANSNTEISSTVQNEAGWQNVVNKVDTSLLTNGQDPVNVIVITPNSNVVSQETLQSLAGKNVTLTVQTQSGTTYILDCANMEKDKIKNDLELSYTITLAENIPERMTGCIVYALRFHNSATFNMEVIMRLPGNHRFQTATLYEVKKQKDLALIQSALVDNNGDAHFYLASVDKKTDYLIGIDVPDATVAHPIIPTSLYDDYTLVDQKTGMKYAVTGRSSSWNMGLGKVMAILAVVMISAIVVIGFVMYFWNKQRLKAGYVPQWEDEEDDQSIK